MEENIKNSEVEAEKKENKPSYDQLKNWLDQVVAQRNQVAERLNQVTDVLNKLPWLFKVLDNKDTFPEVFVNDCVNEIMFILTPPTEEEEKDTPEKEENGK